MRRKKFKWYTLKISIVIILVFILQLFFPEEILNNYGLISSESFSKPWMFFSYMFLHGSFSHIFFNLFALFLFGTILEKIVGSNKFLSIFIISGIASGLISSFFYKAVIGASGAIYGILGTLGVLRPNMVIWIFGVPMYMGLAIIMWAIIDFIGIFQPSQVANIGHLGGLFIGLIVGLYLKKYYGKKARKRRELLSKKEFEEWERVYMRILEINIKRIFKIAK